MDLQRSADFSSGAHHMQPLRHSELSEDCEVNYLYIWREHYFPISSGTVAAWWLVANFVWEHPKRLV